jgi:nitroreductase
MDEIAPQIFDQIVNKRRSMRLFDTANYDPAAISRSLERAVLAPNSSNMQLWAFYRVKTEAKKTALAEACMGQNAAETASEMVVFVARHSLWKAHAQWNLDQVKKLLLNKDKPSNAQKRILQYYSLLIPTLYRRDWFGLNTILRLSIVWGRGLFKPMMRVATKADQRVVLHKSVALAAQSFMLSMAAEDHDTCPMEGFDEPMVKKILGLSYSDEVCMIMACGKGKAEGIYAPRLRVPLENVIFEV